MTLFLDLDGTILDVRPRYLALHRHLIGTAAESIDADQLWGWQREALGATEVARRCGLEEAAAVDYARRWRASIEDEAYLAYDRPFAWIPACLAELRRQRRLVLVTLRRSPERLQRQLAALDLDGCFDAVRVAGTAAIDAAGGAETKSTLLRGDVGYRPDALVVGDTEVDVRAARLAGLRCVAVQSGVRSGALLAAERPDWLLDSLSQLPGLLAERRG